MLVTLFPTYVKADAQLPSEFENPVKNWNFENRSYGPPYPCRGVYNCSPWQTYKPTGPEGGWRELRGDVNRDNSTDIVDITTIALAMGSQPGDGNWNKDADINGDGLVDIVDTVTAAIDFGKVTKRFYGKYSWYTGTAEDDYDYEMYQYLDSSTVNYIRGKRVTFTFWFLPESVAPDGSQNYARAEIWYWIGATRIKCGDWVYPNETKWHSAFVTADIPSSAGYVRVRIRGTSDGTTNFRAWIDQASLAISTGDSSETDDGIISVGANIFDYRRVAEMTYDGEVCMGVGLACECKDNYAIIYSKLKVELLPNGGEPQDGKLNIEYVEQTNDKDYDVDPAENEELNCKAVVAAEICLWAIGAAVSAFTLPAATPICVKFLVASAIKGGTTMVLGAMQTNPNKAHAEGGSDDAVWEKWDYPTSVPTSKELFVQMATGYYELRWVFNTRLAESFQIRITSTFQYGLPQYQDMWDIWTILEPIITVSTSTIITVETS